MLDSRQVHLDYADYEDDDGNPVMDTSMEWEDLIQTIQSLLPDSFSYSVRHDPNQYWQGEASALHGMGMYQLSCMTMMVRQHVWAWWWSTSSITTIDQKIAHTWRCIICTSLRLSFWLNCPGFTRYVFAHQRGQLDRINQH